MVKFMILLSVVIIKCLSANVLVLGESSSKFKCDNSVMSPVTLKECKKIEAIDDINICYMNKSSFGCKKIFGGESYVLDDIQSNPLSFKRLFSFNENQKTSFGVKRFSNEIKEIGIPAGTIIKPDKDIKIELGKNHTIKFTLEDEEKKIIEKKEFVGDAVILQSKHLQYSKTYRVVAKIDGVSHEGSFDVMEKESEIQMKVEIGDLVKDVQDEDSKKIIKSIVYDQYGLNYDRELLLRGMDRL